MGRALWLIGAILLLAAGVALMTIQPDGGDDEINVYSARQEVLIAPLMERFTDETGIEVNLVAGKADALISRLRSEGRNTPADVLLTVDAGNLNEAHEEEDLFQPVESETLETHIPSSYRDPDGHWYGLSLRSRIIVYDPEQVDPEADGLSDYEDLADEQWEDRICIRSSDNVYNQSLVASLIAHNGVEATEEWARGLVDNMARSPQGGDRDQIRAVAAGECDLAVVNSYYLAGMHEADEAADREAAESVRLLWPNQAGRGAHVNVSGAGVIRHSENRDNALRLLEFLAGEEAQAWYAEANQEYPVRPGIEISDTLEQFGEFEADDLPLAELGRYQADAVRLMDRAGWR